MAVENSAEQLCCVPPIPPHIPPAAPGVSSAEFFWSPLTLLGVETQLHGWAGWRIGQDNPTLLKCLHKLLDSALAH